MEPFRYEKKNFSADLGIGQFAISKVELAELWGCDRKTAQKMGDLFNEVGILSSVANNRTTIHTVLCLAFWFVDEQAEPIRNPHYRRNPVSKNGIKDVSDGRDSTPVVTNANNSSNSSNIGSAVVEPSTDSGSSHLPRHTFGSLQVDAGTSIYAVQHMRGHKNVATTQIYADMADETKRQSVDHITQKPRITPTLNLANQ